jgi:hypothetical protein
VRSASYAGSSGRVLRTRRLTNTLCGSEVLLHLRQILLAVLLCSIAPTPSRAEPPWQIDVEEIERIAMQAVHDKYPELPLDDLAAETGVTIMCGRGKAFNQWPYRDPRSSECQAMITIAVKSTVTEKRYTDESGNCRLMRSREPITVHVYEDRSTRVGSRGATSQGDHSVDCPEAISDHRGSPHNKPFKSVRCTHWTRAAHAPLN